MANEVDLTDAFEVSIPTIDTWKAKHLDFLGSSNLWALWAKDKVRKGSLMPAPKGNKFAVGNKGGGRHSQLNPNFVRRAELACRAGFTDRELAELFDVSLSAIEKWKRQHEDFRNALKVGKAEADNRVERSLYHRAVGYNYETTKVFKPANREKPIYAKIIEYMHPDVTAGIFWLKNRDPQHWRDSQQLEHVLGKYLISDKPMSEEDWARERATVIDDDPPRFGDRREERHNPFELPTQHARDTRKKDE